MSSKSLLTETLPSVEAKEICPIAISNRDETEKSRKLASDVVDKIVSKKLFRMGLPKHLGGWEDNPVEVLKTFEVLASAEGSAGWLTWNNHLACTFGRFLDESTMNEVYSNPNHVYANSARPEGFAEETTDGYIMNGEWTLVSGCELSSWLALRCIVTQDGVPKKSSRGVEMRLFFISKEKIEIIDTWNVQALRGTGSHNVKVKDLFVEKRFAVDFDSPVAIDNAYSRLPIGCINAAGNASIALGLAQSGLNDLIKMGYERVTPGKNPDLRDRATVQAAVADGVSALAAARNQLHGSVNKIWELSLNKEQYSDKQLADVWSSSYKAATTAKATLSNVFSVAGTAALYTQSPIERANRDLHAVLQHGIIQPHWMNQAGMAYLGLEPTAAMFRI
ncbi:hypothetical protein [Seonamhaeicola sp. ML3]|uniref:hypothetical protein n=1 Tax=Seonamhaeicola sp. ML3 TaxID=2937786 RepID=UPI00200F77C7|nr:hypothetical protein [Seonamhaeicola sp. ML3]